MCMASTVHVPDWLQEYIRENAPRGRAAYRFMIEDMDGDDLPDGGSE